MASALDAEETVTLKSLTLQRIAVNAMVAEESILVVASALDAEGPDGLEDSSYRIWG